jgi:MFS family permease
VRARFQETFRNYARLDRRIWVMAGVRAINTMGLALAMAFMAIYLVDDRGLAASIYGLIYLVANLLQSLSQAWAGELSDRYGRRGIMVGALLIRSLVIAGIGALVLADAPIWLIACVLVVSATLRGCFDPVAYALVADVADPKMRVAAYGLQRMGTNLGWAIGPALGGLMAAVIHYGYVFFIAAGFLVAAAVATARIRDPGHQAGPGGDAPTVSVRDGLTAALRRSDVTLLLVCSLLFAVVHVQLFSTMSVYGAGELSLSKADLGIAYTFNGLIVLALQIPAVGAIDRMGTGRALVAGSLLYTAAYASIGFAVGLPHIVMAVSVLTVGEVLVAPAHQAAAASLGDRKRMGRAFGLLGLAQMVGVAIAPLFGGVLFDAARDRPLVMWGAIAGVAAVMALAFARLATYLPRDQPSS